MARIIKNKKRNIPYIFMHNMNVNTTYKDSPGVEDHALEGTVLDVLVVVGHVDPPLPRLVRLERRVECSVVLIGKKNFSVKH